MEHNTTRTDRVCRTCPGLGRDGDGDRPGPNYYDYRWACEDCRPQLHGLLRRIPSAYNTLDPTPGGGHHEHVSGSHDAPLGVRIAVLDQTYTGPALANPLIPAGPDQEGVLPAPRILWHIANAWLPAWRESHPSERLPAPYVEPLTTWLDDRLDWACNTLEHLIGDHAAYLSALARRLDHLNDPGTHRPDRIDGVPCRECDGYTLTRHGEDVICTDPRCKVRMGPSEYERWLKLQVAFATQDA
jgi:hypothetical protein